MYPVTVLLHFISVIIFSFLFAYLPGKVFFQILKSKQPWDISLALGIAQMMLILFFGRFLLPVWILLLIYLSLILLCVKKLHLAVLPSKLNIKPNIVVISLIFLGALVQSMDYLATLAGGYAMVEQKLYQSHDQSWHVALVSELTQNFPPQIPGYSGEILKNYHYFYDLFIAANVLIMGGDIALYLQGIYPILISIFYGISVWRIITFLTKKPAAIYIALLFAYLGNNLSYMLTWFGAKEWRSDTLLLDQPIIYLYNHQTVLSVVFVLYILYLYQQWHNSRYKPALVIPMAIMTLVLMNLKMYAFVVAIITLAILGVKAIIEQLYLNKRLSLNLLNSLKYGVLIGLAGVLGIYLLAFKQGGSFININPGWLIDQFFIRNILPISKALASRRAIYQLYQEDIKLFLFDFIVAIIFIIGNFNVRLLGLLSNWKKAVIGQGLLISSIISLIFLLIGNQTSSAFNIIQFGPYAVVSMTLLMAYFFTRIDNLWLRRCIILLSIIISMPVSLRTVVSYEQLFINNKLNKQISTEIECYKNLRDMDKGPVLLMQSGDHRNNNMRAFTRQRAYFTDKTQMEVLGIDFKYREDLVERVNENMCGLSESERDQMQRDGVRYLVGFKEPPCSPFKFIINDNKCYIAKIY